MDLEIIIWDLDCCTCKCYVVVKMVRPDSDTVTTVNPTFVVSVHTKIETDEEGRRGPSYLKLWPLEGGWGGGLF